MPNPNECAMLVVSYRPCGAPGGAPMPVKMPLYAVTGIPAIV